jgi:hypothetical protein
MKIIKENYISSYTSSITIKSDGGIWIQTFWANSSKGYDQANDRCYEYVKTFCRRVLAYFIDGSFEDYIGSHSIKKIKLADLKSEDFEKILDTLEKQTEKKKEVQTLEIN